MFVNWMCKDQKNYDMVVYGIEGTDFTLEGDKINRITTDDLIPGWMLPTQMSRFTTTDSDEGVAAVKSWNDGAKYSKIFGFMFNDADVSAEAANLQAAVDEYFGPIQF